MDTALDSDLAKASCPGPMTLLSFLLLADPSALSALPAAVEIVQREIQALVRAGAREVQLDALTEVSALQLFNYEPRAVADAINGAFYGLRNIVRTVHFCFRSLAGTSFAASQTLARLMPVIELADREGGQGRHRVYRMPTPLRGWRASRHPTRSSPGLRPSTAISPSPWSCS